MTNRRDWALLAIGALLTILVIVEMFVYVLRADQGPLEPVASSIPSPTPAPSPTVAPATPVAPNAQAREVPPGSFLDLLSYAPDRLHDNSLPLSDIATYADIDRWMTAQGIAIPTDLKDPALAPWRDQLDTLALPDILTTRALDGVWRDTYGFDLTNLHQVLAVGSAPDYIIVMRGDFDDEHLLSAWTASGYQAVSVDGITYWSLYPADSVDLSAPASRPALGNMNNLILLDNGTLIATTRSGRMEQTMRVLRNSQGSMAANPRIYGLLNPPSYGNDLVTVVLMKGTVLDGSAAVIFNGVHANATPTEPAPVANLLLVGIQLPPGTGEEADFFITLMYEDQEAARSASNRSRIALLRGRSAVTGEPYSDRIVLEHARVYTITNDAHVLILQMDLQNGINDWFAIVEQRDFGFLNSVP